MLCRPKQGRVDLLIVINALEALKWIETVLKLHDLIVSLVCKLNRRQLLQENNLIIHLYILFLIIVFTIILWYNSSFFCYYFVLCTYLYIVYILYRSIHAQIILFQASILLYVSLDIILIKSVASAKIILKSNHKGAKYIIMNCSSYQYVY